jgi:peptidoglycan glycosyltransferase
MKRITQRAFSVLLLALAVIFGMTVFALRYADEGGDWALYFASANSGAGGELRDRKGVLLASFDATTFAFSPDAETRVACYHVTGDYWDRSGTGALSAYWDRMQEYSLLEGTTKKEPKSLTLTIDASICRAAWNAIGYDRRGAAMLMNYKTGEVLAMVSLPSVDPINGEAPVADTAFINRCLSASFPPGSVFKLVTAAAAIEDVPDLFDRTFLCEGEYTIGSVDIRCSGVHGEQSVEEAMANSCNCAFAQIAVAAGYNSLYEHVKAYGFLDGHELDGIPSVAGSYRTQYAGDPELAWSGIGQSTDLVCPFAMLRYVAAIANGGVLAEPRLILTDEPPAETRLLEASTASKLKEMMSYNVVTHYDPAHSFPGISHLCAKTGTAETGDGSSHAWFTGFLDDPRHPYAFVVVIERGGGGLQAAAPVANRMLQAAIASDGNGQG